MTSSERAPRAYFAVDLGAGSGRVLVAIVEGSAIELEIVHRFGYAPRSVGGRLRWNFAELIGGVKSGLALALAHARARGATPRSVGVDGWGVDYGWLDANGELVADPVCYRDPRTDGMLERVLELAPKEEIHARTGIQFMPINTLVQLYAERALGERPTNAAHFLMVPDLVHHALCGSRLGERTNASTTQLFNAHSNDWDSSLLAAVGVPREAMPKLVEPGTELGVLDAKIATQLGVDRLRVVAPATHDTASAVLGAPLEKDWAYISSGTWSLVGVELEAPLLGAASLAANFTNEAGAFGTTRFLKNVMGLWLFENLRSEWDLEAGTLVDLTKQLLGDDGAPGAAFIDPDDARFLHPANMTRELGEFLRERSTKVPALPERLARVVLESLALCCAEVLDSIETLTGRAIRGVQIVGGGSQNDFLNQATADASGRVVRAGPVEATALGNALLQAIADGTIEDLAAARARVAALAPLREFHPRRAAEWAVARAQFRDLRRAR